MDAVSSGGVVWYKRAWYDTQDVAWEFDVKFSELARLLEKNGFAIVKHKGSIRYYGKLGCDKLIRLDYHGAKEIPTGTCRSILKAAGIRPK